MAYCEKELFMNIFFIKHVHPHPQWIVLSYTCAFNLPAIQETFCLDFTQTRPMFEVGPKSNNIHRLLLTIICPTAFPHFHFQLSKMTVTQFLSEVCTGTYSTPSQVSNIVPSPGNIHINVILDRSGLVQPRFADFQRSFAQPQLAQTSDLYTGICRIIKTNIFPVVIYSCNLYQCHTKSYIPM